MKFFLFAMLIILGLSRSTYAQLSDLPNPLEQLPLPLPDDPSTPAPKPPKLTVGDRVLSGPLNDGTYYRGRVEAVFSNGLISVRDDDDGKLYHRKSTLVLKSLQCDKELKICVGDEVLSGPLKDNSYYEGKIEGIYSNGTIYVRDYDDGNAYVRKASAFGKKINCLQKMCIGDAVTSGPLRDGRFYKGRITGAYTSGMMLVQDEDDGMVYVRDVRFVRPRK